MTASAPTVLTLTDVVRWQRLFRQPGEVTELRAIGVTHDGRYPHTEAGFFDYDHLEDMAKEASRLSRISKGVYFTMNPLQPAILSRCTNRVKKAVSGDLAADANVLGRTWLLIDADPVRPVEGIPSTDEEKAAALEVIQNIRQWLRSENWPEGILADSGNGFHGLYHIDLPADDGGLVERCLKALAKRFDTDRVKIDQKVFNPARICKLYGTFARKGDSTPERPHRQSCVIEAPGCGVVPLELLQALAGEVQQPKPSANGNGHHGDERHLAQAWNYIDKMERAVSGENGHTAAFLAAKKLVKRFELNDADALTLLARWNETCQPPFSEKELRHKIESARTKAKDDPPRQLNLLPRVINSSEREPGEDDETEYRVNLIDSATFAKREYKREYLIQFVVVKDQPGTWAGPIKSMKTSTLVDGAVSIATQTPFLGEFHVPQRRRVAVLSGESGEPTLQEIGRRVCKARGLELEDLKDWLHWGFDLPQLSDPDHVEALQQALKDHGIEVLAYDPLYLGLLGANPDGISAANLYQVGPLLMSVGKACLEVGCTPLLAHHFKLTRKEAYAEPQLDDLAYSGIREYVRQWVLLSRRSPYDPADPQGLHEIWFSAGGSAGHSALRAVNIREGKLKEDFTGRYWQVETILPSDARTANSGAKTAEKGRREEAQDKDDEVQILLALDKMDPDRKGVSFRKLRVRAKVPRERAERACSRLCDEGVLERLTVVTVGGNGAKLRAEGYRRPSREEL
jgi:replicative DNA helicase